MACAFKDGLPEDDIHVCVLVAHGQCVERVEWGKEGKQGTEATKTSLRKSERGGCHGIGHGIWPYRDFWCFSTTPP